MKRLFFQLYVRIILAVMVSAIASATLLWMSWHPDANTRLSRFLEPALLQAASELREIDEASASAQPVVPATWIERVGVAGLHAPTHARLEAMSRLSQETSWPLAALPESLVDLSREEREVIQAGGIVYRQARADQLYAAYVRLNNQELLEATLISTEASLRDLISGLFFLTSRGAQTAPALSAPLEGLKNMLKPGEELTSTPLRDADISVIESARLLYGPRPQTRLTGLSHEVQGLAFDETGAPHLVTLHLNLWAPLFPPLLWVPFVLAFVWIALWMTLSPLRRKLMHLAAVTERFGAGDLSARVGFTEEGPIESLSRRFDRSAERIEALIRSHEALLQAVAHELRTPVARLYFYNDLLVDEPNPEQRALTGAQMEHTLRELTDLTSELLEFARLNAQPTLNHEPCELREIIALALGQLVPRRGAVQVMTAHEGAAEGQGRGVGAVGDIRLLCRAALNLIKNAEAHAVARVCVSCGEGRHPPRGRPLLTPARPLSALSGERGGRTHQATHQAQPHERHQARHQAQPHERHQAQPHERWVWLTVEDDGPGVPAEERGRIFDPFVRLESSRSRAQGGAGLGLSIVQGVAAAHSGVVWVDESPLGGARFTLAFPTPLPEREQGGEQGGERGATSLATPH